MTARSSQELKQLQTRLSREQVKANDIRDEIAEQEKMLGLVNRRIKSLKSQIDALKSPEKGDLMVSEHAIVRYLERAMGFNIKDLENHIVDQDTRLMIKKMGSGNYPIQEGLKAVVKNNVVVTVR